MKNYKKIYQRLIKEIQRMKFDELKSLSSQTNDILKLVEIKEHQYAMCVFNSILEMNEEINGKKCNMVIMNQEEFKKWKKSINM